MIVSEHHERIANGDITPRVVEYGSCTSMVVYVAWTPIWEGPARPDYQAALADLNDRIMTQKTTIATRWHVVAINIKTKAKRQMSDQPMSIHDAETFIRMAVMRRGVEEEFYKAERAT